MPVFSLNFFYEIYIILFTLPVCIFYYLSFLLLLIFMLLFNTVIISVYLMVTQDLSNGYFGIRKNGTQNNTIYFRKLFCLRY